MIEVTFQSPIYLWFILSIPLLIITHFYLLKHSRKKALKFANFETIKRVTGKRLITKNLTVLAIRSVIIFLVVLAVSGSTLWYEGTSNKNDFVIAIDTSASMTAEDLNPTRIDAAKEHAKSFADLLKTDTRIGLVTFAGITFINQVPTTNRMEIKNAIDKIEIMKSGGTDIPGAIITATNLLADSTKGKTIILITDGSNTMGTFLEESIEESIAYAQDHHVIIHAIGTGSEAEEPIGYIPKYYNISAVYNENNLIKITNLTVGRYFHAADNEKLVDAFKELSLDADKAILHIDLSFGLIMIILLLLFVEWGLINTKFRRQP
ncbi:VWA domain-containing protein [archaeon]|nr:VWA domain-containing protein [archaeon]